MVGGNGSARTVAAIAAASSSLAACALVAGIGDDFGFGDTRSENGPDARAADASGSAGDADVAVASSCSVAGDGRTNCGGGAESCCTSLLVPGGTFSRSYDGVDGGSFTDPEYKASVADFRLDRYEITVGRFRAFAEAAQAGWKPGAGSGKHTHLNNGSGLALLGASGYETGWDSAWDATLATLASGGSSALMCHPSFATWTNTAGPNETRPITCETWFEAYAFCIWDGGFLPSEAEWNYAAAGGSEQRAYPWSTPPTSMSLDCTYANYGGTNWPYSACVDAGPNRAGSEAKGNGRWGQADMAGNVSEWVLDWRSDPYRPGECTNCSDLTEARWRVVRGGGFLTSSWIWVLSAYRGLDEPASRNLETGARCARVP